MTLFLKKEGENGSKRKKKTDEKVTIPTNDMFF